tara:strand:- start:4953 stop:6029 length:1077 start_codon:yes stop_codon:yes gene_type:complete
MVKICLVLGTRPEIIKVSSVIRACEKKNIEYFLVHTGQHYDQNMDEIFFEQLKLKKPKYNLNVGSCSPGKQIGSMIEKIEEILLQERPDVVLVQGDTNSVLAGALAANKNKIKVGHIEAGLRSFDKGMPEENNRVMVDHISNFLFVPTNDTIKNIDREGIDKKKVFVVGNTATDAIFQNSVIAKESVDVLTKFSLQKNAYVVVTAHRPANVDDPNNLKKLLDGLNGVAEELQVPLIFAIHPRTKKRIEENGLVVSQQIRMVDPVGYLEFLQLMEHAKVIITDSGGIQEEACVLKVPCVTIRENTERPETLTIGCNVLVGIDPVKIVDCTKTMINKARDWSSPYGDGTAGEKIVEILLK